MNTMIKVAPIALVAALAIASPAAAAGLCPKAGSSTLANAPTMPKGVTDTILSTVDLGPEINVDGRQLRTRRLVIQPGGIVPLHSHKDRPALIYTVSGSITRCRRSSFPRTSSTPARPTPRCNPPPAPAPLATPAHPWRPALPLAGRHLP